MIFISAVSCRHCGAVEAELDGKGVHCTCGFAIPIPKAVDEVLPSVSMLKGLWERINQQDMIAGLRPEVLALRLQILEARVNKQESTK